MKNVATRKPARLGQSLIPGDWDKISDPITRRREYLKHYSKLTHAAKKDDENFKRAAVARSQAWYAKNKNRVMVNAAAWRARNRSHLSMYRQLKRARFLGAIHPEHNMDIEKILNKERIRLTIETGIEHHLDHIIPIALGGFHHHLNLQILPYFINIKKNKKLEWDSESFLTWKDVPGFLRPKILNALKND